MAINNGKYWNPRTELMPRDELEKLQLKKARKLLAWAYAESALWREKFDKAGVIPNDVQSLSDFAQLPFLSRSELNDSQEAAPMYGDILTVSPELAIRYHQTSGTSGRVPLRVLDSAKDWQWVSEMWCYGMYAFGVRASDVVYIAYGYGTFVGFWGAHYASEKIGALTIAGGGISSEERIQKIIDLGVTVLICTPTYAIRLAQVAQEMGIDLAKDSKVRLLIHAGEPGANIKSTKEYLQRSWGARCGDFPGMSETGGSIAFECDEQCGGVHIIEDHYIQEVINPETGRPVNPGEKGELVLTSFGRATLPIIRYRTGDLVERVPSSYCSCGRTFDIYKGGIIGRVDDMKLIRGVNVYPSGVENIIREFKDVSEFQIIFYKQNEIDQVMVKLEAAPELGQDAYQGLGESVAKKLNLAHRLSFKVEVVGPDTLPRFELKAKRVQDIRYV